MYHESWFGFTGGYMWLLWIVLIAAVIWIIRVATAGSDRQMPQSALEILERCYARGDIDREEYMQKRKDLSP